MPPYPDSKLELEYTAGRFPWTEYANGLDRRYTQLLSFRHFKSLHRSFRIQLRLLFYHHQGSAEITPNLSEYQFIADFRKSEEDIG